MTEAFLAMQQCSFTIMKYDSELFLFYVGVVKDRELIEVGSFSQGLNDKQKEALITVIMQNKKEVKNHFIFVHPGICVELQYDSFQNQQLQNPQFIQFLFNMDWRDCTYELLVEKISSSTSEITHPEKKLFPNLQVTKQDYISYLNEVSPFMLSFLQNRLLTVIRFPHGLFGDSFYQKQCPTYAPTFVQTEQKENIDYIICNTIDTLLWLGNQLAFEFHIPFETIYSDGKPSEIVFDLDPPSKDFFHVAVKAAILLKEILDDLHLLSFLKISGNKGIQVYIPLPERTYTYQEVRKFTEFIAYYMVSKEPKLFTIERLKKNRKNRLYIDYIQHSEGKTIICPYSIRGNEGGYVACPISWDELSAELNPTTFTMDYVQKRLNKKIDPFANYFQSKEEQPFQKVLDFIRTKL